MTPSEVTSILQRWIPSGAAYIPSGGIPTLIGLFRAEPKRFIFMEAFAGDQHHVHVVEFSEAGYSAVNDVAEIQLMGGTGTLAVITPIESDATGNGYPKLRQTAEAWQAALADAETAERYERFFTLNS